jgi:hypothetical protein
MFQEFPKVLYKSPDDYVVVKDKEQQDAAGVEGYKPLGEPEPVKTRKPRQKAE